jgi:hypothetical protein
MSISLGFITVLLAGCQPSGIKPAPAVISVPTFVYTAVPAELTQPCHVTKLSDVGGDLVDLAHSLVNDLLNCSADKAAIKGLSGSPVLAR